MLAGLSFAGGLDFTSAYYHRGYLRQDDGLILQPFATVSHLLVGSEDSSVRPYIAFWDSSALTGVEETTPRTKPAIGFEPAHAGHPFPEEAPAAKIPAIGFAGDRGMFHKNEVEIMAGVAWNYQALAVDAKYVLYLFPSDGGDSIHEIGARCSYDLARFWKSPEDTDSWIVRPFAGLYSELANANAEKGTYAEVGIEPAYRFRLGNHPVGLSLPALIGLGLDDYYFDVAGNETTAGYYSVTLSVSVGLPSPLVPGECFVTGSISYLHLIADSVSLHAGDSDVWLGKVGVGIRF